MRWHRGQQIWLGAASLVPGWLVIQQVIKPVHAALVLVFLYFLSKRHAHLVQRQFEREAHESKVREAEEKDRVASLPMRKRRAIERARRRKEEAAAAEASADNSDSKEE
uniref:Uncharacterized protein n=1 Tax=Physcomitrium patens TaxID=3218 RepID=A9TVL7_PHYPA|nr:hypothetical protein PHYPA_002972 [Physcomitrium patens]